MTDEWTTDIEPFKTGDKCWIAITGPLCGRMVLVSYWIDAEQRWNFTSKSANVVVAVRPLPEFPAHLLTNAADPADLRSAI